LFAEENKKENKEENKEENRKGTFFAFYARLRLA
jgi:hypothetical protein